MDQNWVQSIDTSFEAAGRMIKHHVVSPAIKWRDHKVPSMKKIPTSNSSIKLQQQTPRQTPASNFSIKLQHQTAASKSINKLQQQTLATNSSSKLQHKTPASNSSIEHQHWTPALNFSIKLQHKTPVSNSSIELQQQQKGTKPNSVMKQRKSIGKMRQMKDETSTTLDIMAEKNQYWEESTTYKHPCSLHITT